MSGLSEFELVDASKTRRFLNYFLDIVVFMQVLAFLIGYIGSSMGFSFQFAVDHPYIFGWFFAFAYYLLFELTLQR